MIADPPARARPFTYLAGKGPLHADRIPLPVLARRFGTPLYVYSASHLDERFELFERAFATQPHTVCYAVKANSSLALLRILGERGAGFDIVSGGELARVERAAPSALGRIVFSGVGKTAAEIDQALAAKVLIFNVESAGELQLLAARARSLRRRAPFALRVNPDVFADTHPYISTGLREHKFGIAIEQAQTLYREAALDPHLLARGISVHIGSQIRDVTPFGAAMSRVAHLVRDLRADGIALTHLDAGGGLGVEYTGSGFDPEAAVREYAAQILGALRGLGLHLLLEPGRFLVAQSGALLARVLDVKQNGTKTFVITDAGMNDLIRPPLYGAHHEIWPVARGSGLDAQRVVDIVGPVCESGDFFARDRPLAPARPGDLLAILDAGAYGMSLASNYNTRPRPAEVLVDGARYRLIRRREQTRDLFRDEIV